MALCKCKINEENGKSTGKGTTVLVERQLCELYEQLLIESGLISLVATPLRVKALATEVYKCLIMCNHFTKRESEYELRDQNAVTLPNFKTITYGRKSFRYCGAHVWNCVPLLREKVEVWRNKDTAILSFSRKLKVCLYFLMKM